MIFATRLNIFLFGVIGFISLMAIDSVLGADLFGRFFGKLIFMMVLSVAIDFFIRMYRRKYQAA